MYEISSYATKHAIDIKDVIAKLNADGASVDNWTEHLSISYEFNRLIVFDTNFFHLAGQGKGNDILSSKLTQHFVFKTADPVRGLMNR